MLAEENRAEQVLDLEFPQQAVVSLLFDGIAEWGHHLARHDLTGPQPRCFAGRIRSLDESTP